MKERFNKKKLEKITDIGYILFTLEEEVKKCGVLLSYKRQKLKKVLETFSDILDEVRKTKPELVERKGL